MEYDELECKLENKTLQVISTSLSIIKFRSHTISETTQKKNSCSCN